MLCSIERIRFESNQIHVLFLDLRSGPNLHRAVKSGKKFISSNALVPTLTRNASASTNYANSRRPNSPFQIFLFVGFRVFLLPTDKNLHKSGGFFTNRKNEKELKNKIFNGNFRKNFPSTFGLSAVRSLIITFLGPGLSNLIAQRSKSN